MLKKIAIIGVGNMGSAILKGIMKAKFAKAQDLVVTSPNPDHFEKYVQEYGIKGTSDNQEAAREADLIILAVKPKVLPGVLEEIVPQAKKEAVFLSIATGFSLEQAKAAYGPDFKFVRAMPNTPAQVGQGMTGITPNENVSREEIDYILALFSTFGQAQLVSEDQLNAVTGVSGSSPTLVFMMIEAMADAGVAKGLSRQDALLFAAQTVKGASQMVLETGEHPEALKDKVCTPAGTSIEEVRIAEQGNFRSVVIESILAGIEKSEELSQPKDKQ